MSPEQAKGKAVDKRADIWAFGVLLAEMLTGRPMYDGETVSETLAAVIKDAPDLRHLPQGIPAAVRRMLERCLEKDPRRRLRDIGEARFALEELGEQETPATGIRAPKRFARRLGMAAGAVALGFVAAASVFWSNPRNTDLPLMRFTVDLGAGAVAGIRTTVIFSPDGTRIVYPVRASGQTQLAIRPMNQSEATVLPGTEDARDQFFSPDGRWIGFFAGNSLKKISIDGGGAMTLCDNLARGDRGGSWGEDGTIIATLDVFHLFRVPETGEKCKDLPLKTTDDGVTSYRWPQILPGMTSVLATRGTPGGFDDAEVVAISKTGEVKTVIPRGYFGRYLPTGHLVFVHEGTLFAAPFDLKRLEIRGTPARVQQGVAGNIVNGSGQLDFTPGPSGHGTLVYLGGKSTSTPRVLSWMDADGKMAPMISLPGVSTPRVSPDGKTIAFSMNGDIYVYDPQRGSSTHITFTGTGNLWPVWTPDGKHLVYAPKSGGIWWARADGSARPELLLDSKGETAPQSFSPDGRHLVYGQAGVGIQVLPLDLSQPDHPKAGSPEMFLRSPVAYSYVAFSPDGQWLAYSSLESGSYQIYVRRYPAAASDGQFQISDPTGSGRFLFWSRTSSKLLYLGSGGQIMVAEYSTTGGSFSAGTPHRWTEAPVEFGSPYPNLDLAPDGKRFVVLATPSASSSDGEPVRVTFLVNFGDELRRRFPAK
jgi:serine/threonine-protein kinase